MLYQILLSYIEKKNSNFNNPFKKEKNTDFQVLLDGDIDDLQQSIFTYIRSKSSNKDITIESLNKIMYLENIKAKKDTNYKKVISENSYKEIKYRIQQLKNRDYLIDKNKKITYVEKFVFNKNNNLGMFYKRDNLENLKELKSLIHNITYKTFNKYRKNIISIETIIKERNPGYKCFILGKDEQQLRHLFRKNKSYKRKSKIKPLIKPLNNNNTFWK